MMDRMGKIGFNGRLIRGRTRRGSFGSHVLSGGWIYEGRASLWQRTSRLIQ